MGHCPGPLPSPSASCWGPEGLGAAVDWEEKERGAGGRGGYEAQSRMTSACPGVGTERKELQLGLHVAPTGGGRWAPFLSYSM